MKKQITVNNGKREAIYLNLENSCNYEIKLENGSNLDLGVVLNGDGEYNFDLNLESENAILNSVFLVPFNKSKKVILNTFQNHLEKKTKSNLLVKSVLGSGNEFFFKGFIHVFPEAQKTDAYQRNENIILNTDCMAISSPGLEILANDVRCTHGATVGEIDKDELWYLTTRGIEQSKAKEMIINGFWLSAIEKLSDKIKDNIVKQLCLTL